MDLHPHGSCLPVGRPGLEPHRYKRGVSSADTLAGALKLVGKLTLGEFERCTVIDSSDAG